MTTVPAEIARGERLRARPAWKALAAHYRYVRRIHLRELFAADPKRGERLTLEAAGLYLDFSKNRVTDETLRLLVRLAEECGLRARIDAMFHGDPINVTERRAALHVALRAPHRASIIVDGANVVHTLLDRMARGSGAGRGRVTPAGASPTSSTSASAAPTWARSWLMRRCGPTAIGR